MAKKKKLSLERATSGRYRNTFRTGYAIQVRWTMAKQSIEKNYTTVTVYVELVSLGSPYNIISNANKNGSVTINGETIKFTCKVALKGNQTIELYKVTRDIYHANDGTKKISLSTTVNIAVTLSGKYWGNVSASGSDALPTIPRASTPSVSPTSVDAGKNVAITISREVSSFTHKLTYKFGAKSGTIGTNIGTTKDWTVPIDFVNQVPNATSGVCTITCDTYNGSTKIGSKSTQLTVKVPATYVPTIDEVKVTEMVADIATKFEAFVSSKSQVKFEITANGTAGSTIKTCKTVFQEIEYQSTTFESALTHSGTVTAVTTITDSRGRSAKKTTELVVYEYLPPEIPVFLAKRVDASGKEDRTGTYLLVAFQVRVSPVNNRNDNRYKIQYRKVGEQNFTTIHEGTGYDVNTTFLSSSGILHADYEYEVRIVVNDYFFTDERVSIKASIPSGFTLMDFHKDKRGVSIGEVSDGNGFKVGMETTLRKGLTVHSHDPDAEIGEFVTLVNYDGKPTAKLIQEHWEGLKLVMMSPDGQEVGSLGVGMDGWLYPSGFIFKEADNVLELENGWVNYSDQFEQAIFTRDAVGVVHLSGLIKNGDVTRGTVIATLPEGYRPNAVHVFAVNSADAHGRIDVKPNGEIVVIKGNANHMSLSGISFPAIVY